VRLVQELGSVAITITRRGNGIAPCRYLSAARAGSIGAQRTGTIVLNELASRFNSRLSALQQADAGQRVRAVFAAKAS